MRSSHCENKDIPTEICSDRNDGRNILQGTHRERGGRGRERLREGERDLERERET